MSKEELGPKFVPPTAEEALRQIAEQEGDFYHIVSSDGMGIDTPLDTEAIAARAQEEREKIVREREEGKPTK